MKTLLANLLTLLIRRIDEKSESVFLSGNLCFSSVII